MTARMLLADGTPSITHELKPPPNPGRCTVLNIVLPRRSVSDQTEGSIVAGRGWPCEDFPSRIHKGYEL